MDKQSLLLNKLEPIERVLLSRKSDRPKGQEIVNFVTTSFEELHGDRKTKDDKAVICGVGEIDQKRCIFIAQQKGSNIQERAYHNFGMMGPSGYRKVQRMLDLAERFSLPVITIIDTPGADASIDAEKEGISVSIAENLSRLSCLQTPIISLVLGEGCSGGALGVGIADKVIMMEHAYYSVISPEGCAAILWKDSREKAIAAKELNMQSEDLKRFSMVDEIIEENENGFTIDDTSILNRVKDTLSTSLDELMNESMDELLLKRYKKYRSF